MFFRKRSKTKDIAELPEENLEEIRRIEKEEVQRKKEEFNNILEFAIEVSQENPKELHNLIRLLGREVQVKYLTRMLKHISSHTMDEISPRTWWFDPQENLGNSGKSLFDLSIQLDQKHEVSLSDDLVVTSPWKRDSMKDVFTIHGKGRERGEWKQNSNHAAQLWFPMNITWVSNGNHSIAAGIIQRDGFLVPEKVLDISPVFKYVRCDGAHFIDIEKNTRIGEVKDVGFCAIFEIGKLMSR